MTLAALLESADFATRAAHAYAAVRDRDADERYAYAKEANHSRYVADALERREDRPILEVRYETEYPSRKKPASTSSARSDVWCRSSPSATRHELRVEVKLAGLSKGSFRIGSKPAKDVIEWWATDIDRLLLCGGRAHCALVICAQSEDLELDGLGRKLGRWPARCHREDTSSVYALLLGRTRVTGTEAVTTFLEASHRELGARVTPLPPAAATTSGEAWRVRVRPIVVEWLQDR